MRLFKRNTIKHPIKGDNFLDKKTMCKYGVTVKMVEDIRNGVDKVFSDILPSDVKVDVDMSVCLNWRNKE